MQLTKPCNLQTKRTIGLVVPFYWSGRFSEMVRGIRDAAGKFGLNILCFQGFYCNDSYIDSAEEQKCEFNGDVIYDLVKRDSLDGLIIGTLALKSSEHKLQLFEACKSYTPIPMVSIGSSVKNITNILIDNESGFTQLLHHLITDHKYRKIAFIRGPANDDDAEIRYKIFCNFMQQHEIAIAPEWISEPGPWEVSRGALFASKLISQTNDIEVIVCASDGLAIGAIKELNKMGAIVPYSLAVVGFNNNGEAQANIPSITSVELNLYKRGWKAVEILSDYFDGKELPSSACVNTELIIRQSCGCSSISIRAAESFHDYTKSKDNKNTKSKIGKNNYKKDKLLKEIIEVLNIQASYQLNTLVDNLVDSFEEQITDFSKKKFLPKFQEILHEYSKLDPNIDKWNWVLNVLRKTFESCTFGDNRELMYQMVELARLVIGDVEQQEHKAFLMLLEERNASVNSIIYSFNKTTDLIEVLDILYKNLPGMGIPSAYLILYDNPLKPTEYCKLVFAYNESGRIDLPEGGIAFPSSQTVLNGILSGDQRDALVIEPLFCGANQIGYILFGMGSHERIFYELFPSQLGATLWSTILYNKEKKAELEIKLKAEELALSNTALKERAIQLEDAYSKLKENQGKLLISEKMASLGRLTAGIAHELNTPIASIRASLSDLSKLIIEYEKSINDPDICLEDYTEIIKEFKRSVELADQAAGSAASFIRCIKVQTRNVKNIEEQQFDILQVLNNVLMVLDYSLKHTKCEVKVETDYSEIVVFGSLEKMTQVFTNVISNAIEAFESEVDREIIIKFDPPLLSKQQLTFKISDNASGIKPEVLPKIFEPLFSTKPFGLGIGLGLSIVHDIIYGEFGGNISVDTKVGKGTVFTFQIEKMISFKK